MSHLYLDESLDLAAAAPGTLVELAGDEARHAVTVARVRAGERIAIGDGRGTLVHGVVASTAPRELALEVDEVVVEPAASPRLILVQALAKGDRDELAVQAATELGVDAIVPWQASRCVTQWAGARGEKSLDKWRRTAREAAKQSRRPRVPVFAPLMSTREVAANLAGPAMLVLHEAAEEALATCELQDTDEFVLVVGPEGGVAEEELAAFTAAGARPVRLGAPVLRTSTAGAAALAALSLRLGRWS